ncbi:MAG: hypothetical protein H6945_00440 [Zoogloeaceae bacterium]|nr:hypothetical protein [Zoogloeaceae bacterium]
MRSSVRLIVPDVPDRDLLQQGTLLRRTRLEYLSTLRSIEERMRELSRQSRELPGGYPTLVVQRRLDSGSSALRWFSHGHRMLSEERFLASVHGYAPAPRAWILASHLQSRWLNSHARVCRLLAEEYSALAEVLAKSSSPVVLTDCSSSGGLHHG